MTNPGLHNPFRSGWQQTLVLERKVSVDEDGQSVFASGSPVACRVFTKPTRVPLATGEEVLAGDLVWVASGTGLAVEDRVTLPSGRVALLKLVDVAPDHRGRVWVEKGYCV